MNKLLFLIIILVTIMIAAVLTTIFTAPTGDINNINDELLTSNGQLFLINPSTALAIQETGVVPTTQITSTDMINAVGMAINWFIISIVTVGAAVLVILCIINLFSKKNKQSCCNSKKE